MIVVCKKCKQTVLEMPDDVFDKWYSWVEITCNCGESTSYPESHITTRAADLPKAGEKQEPPSTQLGG